MSEEQVVWGILGCGDVTEVKSGPALRGASRSTVASCMRRDGAKAADYAARHGIPRWTDDAEAMLSDPALTAIYVATPPDTHRDYAVRALEAGKDVLVEKPMALTVAECDAMAEAAARTGRSLSVAYYRRALPRFEALRAIVGDGTIGEPRLVEVRHFLPGDFRPDQPWKIDPAVGGGGLFADMQSHALDWLGYAFGEGTARGLARRQAGGYAAEDLVAYVAEFGGVPAVGLCSYAASEKDESVTVHGSEGSASMGFFRPSPVTVTTRSGTREVDRPDPPHVHEPFVERVVAHLLDGAPNPCPPEDARRVNALLDAIYAGL
ncbi:Gfo/Idh/MocA family oxidoreductase [Jannaschia sp. LMIT008]|uniref:Gfo/Idh/MocA family protein n=1 Tax=Jannaschia maritima TaxID=3032585 RepID=UPI002811ECA6|nr:Gfo/Idh/MocA family oxidoreductase [Jannaschia sp. LMIT008]